MGNKNDKYFSSILSSLSKEFSQKIEEKINEKNFEHLDLDTLFDKDPDSNFHQILYSMGNIAVFCHDQVLDWLLNWRSNKTIKSEETLKSQSALTLKDIGANVINSQDIYDYSFVLCLREILPKCNNKLERHSVQQILKYVFEIVKYCSSSSEHETKRNKNYIMSKICGQVIDYFGDKNIDDIQDIFFDMLDSTQNMAEIISIISCLKFFRIKSFSISHVEDSFAFLTDCGKRMLKAKEKEVKFAFMNMIAEILLPFSSKAKTELNVLNVKNFVESLSNSANEMIKKMKYLNISIPFSTSILCCGNKSFFLAHYHIFINAFIQSAKGKDMQISRVSLECIYKIVWVYFVRFKCEDSPKTLKFLHLLTNSLILTSRANLYAEFDHIFVKIINAISIEKQTYALNEIILELCAPPSSKHHTSEKMSVGLKSYIILLETFNQTGQMMSEELHSPHNFYTTKFLTMKFNFYMNKEAFIQSELNVHLKTIQDSLYQTLSFLDNIVGKPFMKTSPMAPQKYSIDQLSFDKRLKMILFKQCVSYITKFPITSSSIEDVSDLLTRLSLHIDEDMQIRALAVMKVLFLEYESYRNTFISNIVHTYLKEIPDSFPHLMLKAINNIQKLIYLWCTSMNEDADGNNKEIDVSSLLIVEGFCLIILCNKNKEIRIEVCNVMKEIHQICDENKKRIKRHGCLLEKLSSVLGKRSNTNDFDLLLLINTITDENSWYKTIGEIFTKLNISEDFKISLKFSQSHCLMRFNYFHTQLETCFDSLETISFKGSSTKLSKKLPNYCDTSSWLCYLTIFCVPFCEEAINNANLKDVTSSAITIGSDTIKSSSLLMVQQVFSKAVSLFRSEYFEMMDMTAKALSLTTYSLIPTLITSFNQLMRDLMDLKTDLSAKKRKKRDYQIVSILKIFDTLSLNGHLIKSLKHLEPQGVFALVDFCEACRSSLIPLFEFGQFIQQARKSVANIISSICHGLYHQNNSLLFSSISRTNFFGTFMGWLSSILKNNDNDDNEEVCIIRSIFSLLYKKGILDDNEFTIKTSHIFHQMDVISSKKNNELDRIIIEAIEVLLTSNGYSNYMIEWIFCKCYTGISPFNSQLFFVLLDYFERQTLNDKILIKVLSLIFIKSHNLDSFTYLRLRQTIVFILNNYFEEKSPIFQPIQNFQSNADNTRIILDCIMSRLSLFFIPIINEFFKMFQDCHSPVQLRILTSFEIIFHQFTLKIFSIDFCDINTTFFNKIETKREQISLNPSKSLMIVNNMMVLTRNYFSIYPEAIKKCWINLCFKDNQSFLSFIHYLFSLSQHNLDDLQFVIKIIIECFAQENASYLISFVITHLKTLNYCKLVSEPIPNSHYVRINLSRVSYSSYNLLSINQLNESDATSKSAISLVTSQNSDIEGEVTDDETMENFYLPFHDIFLPNSVQTIQGHFAFLIFASYIFSLKPIPMDNNTIFFVHLSILGLLHQLEIVRLSSKKIILYFCIFLINSSQFTDETKHKIVMNITAAICCLNPHFSCQFFVAKKEHNAHDTLESLIDSIIYYTLSYCENDSKRLNSCNASYEFDVFDFVEMIKSLVEMCEFSSLFFEQWVDTCVLFACKSSSLSLSKFSILSLISLKLPVKDTHFKEIIKRYCDLVHLKPIEIKVFTSEIVKGLFEMSIYIICSIKGKEITMPSEFYQLFETSIWFFIQFINSNEKMEVLNSLNYIYEFITLSEALTRQVFESIMNKSTQYHGLFFEILHSLSNGILINYKLLLLLKLYKFFDLKFIIPDCDLGTHLFFIALTYHYLDYFSEVYLEIHPKFTKIIQICCQTPQLKTYGKLLEIFNPPTKRKDVDLFLKLCCIEIIGLSNVSHFQISLNWLANLIKTSDSKLAFKAIIFLNAFTKLIGSSYLNEKEIENILGMSLSYTKDRVLSNAYLDLVKNIFSSSASEEGLCPHKMLTRNTSPEPETPCDLCSSNNDRFINFIPVVLNPSPNGSSHYIATKIRNTIETPFSLIPEETCFPNYEISSDYSDLLEIPSYTLKSANFKPVVNDSLSISSFQITDEIFDVINILEEQLEDDKISISLPKNSGIRDENKYYFGSNYSPNLTPGFSNPIISFPTRSYLSHDNNTNSKEEYFNIEKGMCHSMDEISNKSPDSNKKDAYLNPENNNHHSTPYKSVELPKSTSDLTINVEQKFDKDLITSLHHCLYFANDTDIKNKWHHISNNALQNVAPNSFFDNDFSLQNFNLILNSIIFWISLLLKRGIDDVVSLKLLSGTILDDERFYSLLKSCKYSVNQICNSPDFPVVFINGKVDKDLETFYKSFSQFVIFMSGLMDQFFEIFFMFNFVSGKDVCLPFESFDNYFTENGFNIISFLLFKKLKESNKDPSLFDLSNSAENYKAKVKFFRLFKMLCCFAQIIETYSNYVESLTRLLSSVHSGFRPVEKHSFSINLVETLDEFTRNFDKTATDKVGNFFDKITPSYMDSIFVSACSSPGPNLISSPVMLQLSDYTEPKIDSRHCYRKRNTYRTRSHSLEPIFQFSSSLTLTSGRKQTSEAYLAAQFDSKNSKFISSSLISEKNNFNFNKQWVDFRKKIIKNALGLSLLSKEHPLIALDGDLITNDKFFYLTGSKKKLDLQLSLLFENLNQLLNRVLDIS